MKSIISNIFLLAFLLLLGSCKKTITLEIPAITDYNGVDSIHKIILTNSDTVQIFNNTIWVNEIAYQTSEGDGKISTSKEYKVSKNGVTYSLFKTELPIVSIITDGEIIIDEPKTPAKIALIENGYKSIESHIGIELRGVSSQSFPKKSYSLELWEDKDGLNNSNISLLGMRMDDDWVLDGMWNEPLRIRDYCAHSLWLSLATNVGTPQTKMGILREYCELFVNNEYYGVYYLGEKFDHEQLDLAPQTNELRGELYKTKNWADGVLYSGLDPFDSNAVYWSGFEPKFPEEIDNIDWSKLYSFVDFVVHAPNAKFNDSIKFKASILNMAEYYIFINTIYASDNYGKNLYTVKVDKEKPYFFTPWDMDATIGNNWEGNRFFTNDKLLTNGLYDRLLENNEFKNIVKQRWSSLRTGVLGASSLKLLYRKQYELLENNLVYQREALVPEMTQNYSKEEFGFMQTWIEGRLRFLDGHFSNL